MGTGNCDKNHDHLVFTYHEHRITIGILGLALPFVLLVGGWFCTGDWVQTSISAYYYTCLRDIFVGTLFVIGFFLLSYRGYKFTPTKWYELTDDFAGDVACIAALGVALFPTAQPGASMGQMLVGSVHFLSAAVFFLILIYFSCFLFTKTDSDPMPDRKKKNNTWYRRFAVIMGICIISIGAISALEEIWDTMFAWVDEFGVVFWLEAVAVWAFAFSWLIKGTKDKNEDDACPTQPGAATSSKP